MQHLPPFQLYKNSSIAQTNIKKAQLFSHLALTALVHHLKMMIFCPFHVLTTFLKICFAMKIKSVTCLPSWIIQSATVLMIFQLECSKQLQPALPPFVASLFNLSLKLGRLPLKWKGSTVVPIPKVSVPKTPRPFSPNFSKCAQQDTREAHL